MQLLIKRLRVDRPARCLDGSATMLPLGMLLPEPQACYRNDHGSKRSHHSDVSPSALAVVMPGTRLS